MVERGIIEADPRHTVRRIRTAIQGDAIRALVELITNADDSYIRLEEDGKQNKGVIKINYQKEGFCGIFSVCDNAEGMSIDDVRNSFKKYGAATSGMKIGKGVRGYFGQGAKDALASMIDGKICTFKDNNFVECKLFIKDGKPMYEISDSIHATLQLRNLHKIDGNGTIAYFKLDPQKTGKVPQFNTVHQELANNYLLRKIMTNPNRKLMLIDVEKNELRPLRYQMPEGKEVLQDDFIISYENYNNFPVHMSLFRAEKELTQSGDNRDGGLLIVDDKNAVLGISLFKYENEPLAAHFVGEIKIESFRELLDNEEAVLREERDGLVARHPFCQKLIAEIEKRIEIKIKEERLLKQKQEQSKIDREESIRFKKAFSILNEIAETEAQAEINLGQEQTKDLKDPPDGFCLYPSSAQITVGKRYAFKLCLNTKVIPTGSTIKIVSSTPKIRLLATDIKLSPDDGIGILSKYITVEGSEPNIEGILTVSAGNKYSKSKIYVVPEKELLLDEGMVFQPESIKLRPNQPRKIYLLVYVKIIESGSEIKITSDNESVHVSHSTVLVNETDAIRHVAKYELEIWGEGAGQDATISAEYESFLALLEAKVRSKEEEEEKSRKGMFSSEPEFNYEPEPLQRTSYSTEIGKVIIYVNFPSVKHYIGENCQYKKTLTGQVFLADLVAERCFFEIAKKKVESGSALIRPEAKFDKIQSETYIFSKKYGKKLHEALVDQKLLEKHRSVR